MAQSKFIKERIDGARIHPTAIVEKGASIGKNTAIWDSVHIRKNAKIGHDCIVGEKSYIAYDVKIGNYVKINAFVYIPTGVTVEDKVMISAGCIFVNDKYPRAYNDSRHGLASSAPNEETLKTVIREGATIGAAATVLGGLEIGRFALVGAGSVITKSVPAHALVVGNPARQIGWVCACGRRLERKASALVCAQCSTRFKTDSKKTKLTVLTSSLKSAGS